MCNVIFGFQLKIGEIYFRHTAEYQIESLKQFSANDDANFSNNLIRKNRSGNFVLCIVVRACVYVCMYVCVRYSFLPSVVFAKCDAVSNKHHSKYISCRLHFTFLFTINMPFCKSHKPRVNEREGETGIYKYANNEGRKGGCLRHSLSRAHI